MRENRLREAPHGNEVWGEIEWPVTDLKLAECLNKLMLLVVVFSEMSMLTLWSLMRIVWDLFYIICIIICHNTLY